MTATIPQRPVAPEPAAARDEVAPESPPEGRVEPDPARTTLDPASRRRVLTTLLVSVVVFLLLGLLGRAATFPGQTLSLVWPAAGGAVLVLGLLPRRCWPLAAALLALATFGFNVATGVEASRAVVFVVPNVVQAVTGALVLRWTAPALLVSGGRQPLTQLRDFRGVALACALSSLAAVVSGTVGLVAIGTDWQPLDAVLWWGRNSAGSLVTVTLAALLLEPVLRRRGELDTRGDHDAAPSPPRRLELLALIAVSVSLYLVVFGYWAGLPLAFPLLVPAVWAGMRFGARTTALHSLALGAVVAVATLRGEGPFAEADTWADQALVSQLFIALLFGLGVMLALGAAERRELHRGLAAARDAASNQAALLSTVIDSMHEGLTVVDERGLVLLQNPSGRQLLHHAVAQQQHLTQAGIQLRSPDGQPLEPADLPFTRALRGEDVRSDEVHVSVPDRGPDRVLSMSARRLPFVSDEGLPQAVVIYHDVTTQRAHRQALENFARVLAHDLKGPLSVVQGWTELLLQQAHEGPTVASAEVVSTLDRVAGAAGGMRRLIQDLLESSTARDQQLRLVDVDLHAVATSVVRGHLDRAEAGRASVDVGPLPPVHADEALVRQLLDNLVGNALKYVAPGAHAEVSLRGRSVGDVVEVVVADRGIGIAAQDREAVFTAFHRAADAGGFEGHGIGLSVCQTIVERHGGTIVARDRADGPGTAFVLTLPAARPGAQVDPGPQPT